MKYSEKALATIKGKKLIFGMLTAGIMTAGLAAPVGASAASSGSAIDLGTMASGSLQGSTWDAQAQTASQLHVSSASEDDGLSSTATTVSGNVRVSSGGSITAPALTSPTEQQSTDLQGGLGLSLHLAGSNSAVSSSNRSGLLGL